MASTSVHEKYIIMRESIKIFLKIAIKKRLFDLHFKRFCKLKLKVWATYIDKNASLDIEEPNRNGF